MEGRFREGRILDGIKEVADATSGSSGWLRMGFYCRYQDAWSRAMKVLRLRFGLADGSSSG
jgi:hypothetical protein